MISERCLFLEVVPNRSPGTECRRRNTRFDRLFALTDQATEQNGLSADNGNGRMGVVEIVGVSLLSWFTTFRFPARSRVEPIR